MKSLIARIPCNTCIYELHNDCDYVLGSVAGDNLPAHNISLITYSYADFTIFSNERNQYEITSVIRYFLAALFCNVCINM